MLEPALRERILADLDRLTPEQQRRAAELVHGLVSPLPTGASIDDLLHVAGTLSRWRLRAPDDGCDRG
jgi:hypothetical protein